MGLTLSRCVDLERRIIRQNELGADDMMVQMAVLEHLRIFDFGQAK
jgi:hypothetical protein